jgi:DNA-binding NarL/FixJ family response regulator
MPNILILSDDLIDTSKTLGAAKALGLSAGQRRTITQLVASLDPSPDLIVIDLHHPDIDAAQFVAFRERLGSVRVVGYGSHVDAVRLKAARAAGWNLVLPRSAYFERMETQLGDWLAGRFGKSSEIQEEEPISE